MRILEIVHFFSPMHGGGTINVLHDQAKQLSKRGHKVTIYTSDFELSSILLKSLSTVRIRVFRSFTVATNIYITLGMIPQLKNELRNYDIIHIHCYRSFQSIIVYYFSQLYHVPYVIQAHGGLPRLKEKGKLSLMYDLLFGNKLLKNASKVIALNSTESEQYKIAGVPPDKIAIVPNGIKLGNLPSKGAFKKKYALPSCQKIIIYLGRLHEAKRIDLLLNAFDYIIKDFKNTNSTLIIAGPDDGYLTELLSMVNSCGLSNFVIFTGFITEEDKLAALVDADVFVTPAFSGFPMTFLESCAVGTPIVTTTLGDVLEWINGNAGFVTKPTKYAIAEAIYSLISDDCLHKKFSKNCREIVNSMFSTDGIIKQIEQIYSDVISY